MFEPAPVAEAAPVVPVAESVFEPAPVAEVAPAPTTPSAPQDAAILGDAIVDELGSDDIKGDVTADLDTPSESAGAFDVPEAPISIFGNMPSAPATPIEPLNVDPQPAPTTDDDWISHAPETPATPAAPAVEAPAESIFDTTGIADIESTTSEPESTGLFGNLPPQPADGAPLTGDALWHIDESPEAPALATPETAPLSTDQVDHFANLDATPDGPLGDVAEQPVETPEVDYFSLNPEPAADGADSGVVTPSAASFETDEDLPIPDFTGVYEESSPVFDASPHGVSEEDLPLAEGPQSQHAASARREELDRLRPEDPPVEDVAVEEPASSTFGIKTVLMVFLVLAVLAVLLLAFDVLG